MVEITHDVFDIAWRMKSIDRRYRLYYNRKAKRYEVYIGSVRQAIIPYDTLDVRTLHYLRKTRCENIEKLISEIERHNQAIDDAKDYEIMRRAENRIEEVLR